MNENDIENIRDSIVGINTKVKLNRKEKITPINFDNAATTPAFKSVLNKILEESLFYSSIARGDGEKSEHCSDTFECCRDYLLNYFNAPQDFYTAIFTNNTTDSLNKLANTLIENKEDIVVTTRMEHHSNDLPWRNKCNLKYVEVDDKGILNIDNLENILRSNVVKYVTVTAASNVTGYINDIRKIAKLSHKYGAKIIVDGAQIVSHKKISMLGLKESENIDFLVFSGHKVYAPFGSGAIIALKKDLDEKIPHFKGGGSVEIVRDYDEIWLKSPQRLESGTPNYFGVISMVESFKKLEKIGFKNIEENEKYLANHLINEMRNIKKIRIYNDVEYDKLGIILFNLEGKSYEKVAELLNSLRAIAVRQGGFCAHSYVRRLLGIKDKDIEKYIIKNGIPGMVRVSLGVYNSKKECDIFLETLESISKL